MAGYKGPAKEEDPAREIGKAREAGRPEENSFCRNQGRGMCEGMNSIK